MRRKYSDGRCEDCGHVKSTTVITFWTTGMKYRVCSECIKPYRKVIVLPARSKSVGAGV
jgi:hypothetical protein